MLDAVRVDFVACHIDPVGMSVAAACEMARKVSRAIADRGLSYYAVFEQQNWCEKCLAPDGFDWAARPDGTHRLKLPEGFIPALDDCGNLKGIIYDEFEHTIINRNASLGGKTDAFRACDKADIKSADLMLDEQTGEYVRELHGAGAGCIAGEHVFPVLFHTFARNGITPNFKSQKEGLTTVYHAIAAGACLEYNTEIMSCVDLWFMRTNPGHSPEEMYNNLVFMWYAGLDRVYVESVDPMVTEGQINAYGKVFMRFMEDYGDRPQPFRARDYAPETGIIRADDTFWGQCGSVIWKKMLFGNPGIKPARGSREYIHVFHLLTHGVSCMNGINWGRMTPWSLRKHFSFAPMNSAAVFDDAADIQTLKSLRLLFLCGEYISSQTLAAVRTLVKENGLTVVTKRKFAPAVIPPGEKKNWIIVRDFRMPFLKYRLRRFLGGRDEIRLTFTNGEVTLYIENHGDAIKERHLSLKK